jgi:hypothetical protein
MTPLLAFDDGLIKLLIFVVVGIVYVINYLLGGRKGAAQKRQRDERRKANDPASDRQAAQTAAQRREIEEFQRSRQKEQRRPAISAAKPAKQVATKKPPRRLSESPIDAEIVDRPGEGVAAHVAKHLENQVFDQRAAHMTDDLTKADREREEHSRKVFDHSVGRIPQTASQPEPRMTDIAAVVQHAAQSPGAELLVTMLSNPTNLRHAIVLNEILHRPTERW